MIVAVDQSGSMAESVVYAAVFGCVMATISAISTRLVVFDTSVVDLTDELSDPVDVLFAVQLGGGTDIGAAFEYCASMVSRPSETVMVLISDLFEGGARERLLARVGSLVNAGVCLITLLALSDSGHPGIRPRPRGRFRWPGCASFACTPDVFPDVMAAALSGQDLQAWAASHGLT